MQQQRPLDKRTFLIFALMCLSQAPPKLVLASPLIHNIYRLYGVVLASSVWYWTTHASTENYGRWRNLVVTFYKFGMAALPMLRLPYFLQRKLAVEPKADFVSTFLLEPTRIITGSRLVIPLLLPVLLPQSLLGTLITQAAFFFGIRNNESLCSTTLLSSPVYRTRTTAFLETLHVFSQILVPLGPSLIPQDDGLKQCMAAATWFQLVASFLISVVWMVNTASPVLKTAVSHSKVERWLMSNYFAIVCRPPKELYTPSDDDDIQYARFGGIRRAAVWGFFVTFCFYLSLLSV